MSIIKYNGDDWLYKLKEAKEWQGQMDVRLYNKDKTRAINLVLTQEEFASSDIENIMLTYIEEAKVTTGVDDISYDIATKLANDIWTSECDCGCRGVTSTTDTETGVWKYDDIRCKCCGYEWVAVFLQGVDTLECPECSKMCGVVK